MSDSDSTFPTWNSLSVDRYPDVDPDRAPAAARGLTTENEREPINIDPSSEPRLSWQLDEDRGLSQTAYRIVVGERSLQDGLVAAWDTGRIESSRSIGLPCSIDLTPEMRYEWRVKVWADDGSGWSEPATFETALPSAESGWVGEWIGADLDPADGRDARTPPDPLFRRQFELGGEIVRARLHVAGLGVHEIRINGNRIGDRYFDPAMTDFEETVHYVTHDVTDALVAGSNCLGVAVGRGRYGEPVENEWEWHEAPWWSDPQLLLQCTVWFSDGRRRTIGTDTDWRVTDGPTRYDSFFCGEDYDARHRHYGWTAPEFDDSSWTPATDEDGPDGTLRPQRIQPVKAFDRFDPVAITEPQLNTAVADFGQMIAGVEQVSATGPAGTEIELTLGDKLTDDGTVYNDNSFLEPSDENQTDTFTLAGDGRETFEPRFSYKGFRYLQLDGFPGEVTAKHLSATAMNTAFQEGCASGFVCSNELLNQIRENTRWAVRNKHLGLPATPTYEKNGWTSQAMAETVCYDFDALRLYEKWLRDHRESLRPDGNLPVITPTSGWGYQDPPWPAWTALDMLIPWWLYRHHGDPRVLDANYEMMRAHLEYTADHRDDGVYREGLGDWVPPAGIDAKSRYEQMIPPEGPAIVATSFLFRLAEVVSETATVLGEDGDANRYGALAEDVRTAFNREFYDSERGYYRTGEVEEYRQTSNVFPLAFDLVPDGECDRVIEHLVHDVAVTHDEHLNTGFHGTKYLLPVLSETGHHDLAYAVATQRDYPSWGYWIDNGMTALLEQWTLNARSRSHQFLGTIVGWFYEYLAGIQPASPGFGTVDIAPRPAGELSWVDATVDTVRGEIDVEWERPSETAFDLRVALPGNTDATVRVPLRGQSPTDATLTADDTVVWAGRPANTIPGLSAIRGADAAIVCSIGAGTYDFELSTGDSQ